MSPRVDNVHAARADFTPPHDGPPPPPPNTDPPDPGAPMLADNLQRFVDAARRNAADELDAQRSLRIRSFYNRFDVEVPVLEGRPGETRRVAVPFRMSIPEDNGLRHAALLEALGPAPSRAHAWLVVAGRATPDQIAAVVRDLAVRHPEEFDPDKRACDVRDYLRDLGVGIDCADSVQLALFASRGLTPDTGQKHFGLRRRLDEDLTRLDGNPRFARISDPADLHPSDLIILKPPRGESVGHTVIVTDRAPAVLTAAEAKSLLAEYPALAVAGKPVVKVSVASSFGYEGPQERVWVYDPETQSWGDLGGELFDDDGAGQRTPANSFPHSGPWNHDIHGMYHAR